MDYIFTTLLIGIGVWFNIMQNVRKLRLKYPEFSFRKVWAVFIFEEWDSLFVSFLCWLTYELGLWIIQYNGVILPHWFDMWGMYVVAIVWGYGGQRIAYKYLGTAESKLKKLSEKIDQP